jgi:hypothetical protein
LAFGMVFGLVSLGFWIVLAFGLASVLVGLLVCFRLALRLSFGLAWF